MAEAGPSSPGRTLSNGTNSPSPLRQPRVQFPHEEDESSAGDSVSYGAYPIGLGPPPGSRKTASQSRDAPPAIRLYNDARPRVRSADAFPAFASQSIALDNGDIGRHTRSSRPNRRSIKQQRGMQSFTMNGRGDFSQSSAFSDEYDLCKFSLGSPCVVC